MSRREKMILLAATAALLVTGSAIHGWAVTSRSDRLAELQQQRDALNAQAYGEALAAGVAELRQTVAAHARALPAGGEIGDLLEAIGTDLSELDVADRSVTTGTPTTHGELEQIPLNMTFRGSFASTFDLLNRLDAYERVIRVERVTISRDARSESDALTVAARLLTFAHHGQEER